MKHRRTTAARRAAAIGLAVAAAVLIAACGSSSKSSSSGGSSGSSGSTATAAPITIMTMPPISGIQPGADTPRPELATVAQMYAKTINAKGGINGHPLNVIVCDDHGDRNAALDCARTAISKHVAALIGTSGLEVGGAIPILERGDIPDMSCCSQAPEELVSNVAFLATSGRLAVVGMGVLAGNLCKRPVLISPQTAVLEFSKDLVGRGAKAAGGALAGAVGVPVTAQDWSPSVAQAMKGGTDCLVAPIGGPMFIQLFTALKSGGYHPRVIGTSGNFSQSVIDQFPDLTKGTVITGYFQDPQHSAPWASYRDAIAKNYPTFTAGDTGIHNWYSQDGLSEWANLTIFANVAKTVKGDVTNKAMMDAFGHTTQVPSDGLIPDISFTTPWSEKGLTRLFNRTTVFMQVENGKLVPYTDKFWDLTGAYEGSGSIKLPQPAE